MTIPQKNQHVYSALPVFYLINKYSNQSIMLRIDPFEQKWAKSEQWMNTDKLEPFSSGTQTAYAQDYF